MKIKISDYNSAGIKSEAKKAGARTMELIGQGHSDGDENNPNSVVRFFELDNGLRVADTNGDPVWEEEDFAVFAELAESCGVEL